MAPLPPYFRRPCMYFELLNEPDSSDNYYKYLEVCCYQKVNTIKRMRFNRKNPVLVTNHFKVILFSNFCFHMIKIIIKTNSEFVGRIGEHWTAYYSSNFSKERHKKKKN